MIGIGNDVNVFLTKAALEHLLGPQCCHKWYLGPTQHSNMDRSQDYKKLPYGKITVTQMLIDFAHDL